MPFKNNKYGMGTPIDRASATHEFYHRGDYIPGIQFDGMNVLQAAETARYAINHAKTKGPILLEAMTYRCAMPILSSIDPHVHRMTP